MKSIYIHCRWSLVWAIILSIVANGHATDWFDDFSDGNAEDGNPVMWEPYADLLPGIYDASSGDYVLTPTDENDRQESLTTSVNGISFGDTYARTQTYVDTTLPNTGGNVGLVIRFDPLTFSGYAGLIDTGDWLGLVKVEWGMQEELLVVDPGEFNASTDVMLELSAMGNLISLTAWELGQPKPEPQITYTDTNLPFTSGSVGIVYVEDTNDTSGVFRWVAASDVPFVDASADFDEDGNIDGTDFLAWQRGFGMTSGALHSDGDADGNGTVDSADLDIWKADFGTTGSSVVITAVPEPTSILLANLLLIVLTILATHHRL